MENKPIYIKTHKKSENVVNVNDNSNDDLSEFVGVRFETDKNKNGQIYIHYPKSLGDIEALESKEQKRLLLSFFKSLKLLKNADYDNKSYDNKIKNINLDKYPLFSFLWIWDDFKAHGRLIFNEVVNKKNASGKINWKKTFQGNSLYYNGNIYFDDYVYKKKIEKENLITEIYDYCVYKSLEMIFFLTNLSQNIIHPLYKNIEGRKNEYKNCLNELIEGTFDDEKKLRYKHMLNIVDSYSFDSLINKNVIGVSSYAGVFEKEINCLIGNVPDISRYYPKAFIHVDGKEPELLSNLREDTINITNDECLIVDSKFYEFGNMPQSDSVEKQIVYGEEIEKNHKINDKSIYNVFLIPRCFADEGWHDSTIKYYGYSYSSWKNNNKQYEKVLIYFIDLKYVIGNYRNGYNDELFTLLKEDAKRVINTI